MRNNSQITDALMNLGLTKDEIIIYLSLLKGKKNHLEISRETGIARSNVYRIVDNLIDKGIVHETITEEDKVLQSASPRTLELLVLEQEKQAVEKREVFKNIMPLLSNFVNQDEKFMIKSYKGLSGLKLMLWNELETKSEVLIFSCGNLSKATGKQFAEKFRFECITRGIMQRAIENIESEIPTTSDHAAFSKHYQLRLLPKDILTIMPEITIHDDTVSIYNNWQEEQLGTEIKNPFLVTFMRQMFEHYWKLAKETK